MTRRYRWRWMVVLLFVTAPACGGQGSSSTATPSTTRPTASSTTASTAAATTATTLAPAPASIEMAQGSDPETHQSGVQIIFRWSADFPSDAAVVVSLYQDDVLVGRIPFDPGWDHEAPAFFRTAAAGSNAALYATGVLRRDGRDVDGSLARTEPSEWPVRIAPGQVVRYMP